MNSVNRLDMGLGRRVQAYLSQHWDEISPHLGIAQPAFESLRTRLDVAIGEVESIAKDRGLGTQKTVVRNRKYLRRTLHRYHMRTLKRVSQLIEEAQPGRAPLIVMAPDSENEEILLTAARSAVKDVLQHRTLFEQYGMPTDLPARIQEIVAAIDGARNTRDEVVTLRIRANAGTEAALRRVKRVIQCMTPILNPVFDSMPEQGPSLRRSWISASRRYQPALSESPTTPVTPTTTTATGGAA